MQRLDYYVATSLDGKIARADSSVDFLLAEGDHVPDYAETLRTFDAVVMGRRTYGIGADLGVTNPYPWLRTYVASRTLEPSSDPNVTIVGDDLVNVVRSLKAQPGRGIYLCGGGKLAALLLEHGLVDDVTIKLNPVIAGGGIPLVSEMTKATHLELSDTKVYANGVVLLRYRVKR